MSKAKLFLPLSTILFAAALAIAPASAKSSSASHSSSSHSSSHSSSSHSASSTAKTRKPLPAGTHFARKTCKTASCKAKHPGGSYMIPIKPKKGRAA